MRSFRGVLRACAAVTIAACAIPATASADPEAFPGAVPGMSAPSSVIQTPDGGIWVGDDGQGVCRVAFEPTPRLVESPWCQPEADHAPGVPEEPHPEAPHDEAGEEPVVPDVPPPAGARPGSADGLVFDATTSNFYVADRASSSGGVWRLHLAADGTIDQGERIAYGGVRIQSVALGPPTTPGAEPDVIFMTKVGSVLMRIADPATAPKYPQRIGVLGDAVEAGGMVGTDDALYIADGGVKRVRFVPGGTAPAETLPGFEDVSVSSVAIDPTSRRLYAGTSNLNGEDLVKVLDLDSGATEPYEIGFNGVTALTVAADGRLLVADDPGIANGTETPGLARLWRVAVQPLGRPQVRITAGPAALGNARSVTLRYESRAGTEFECRIDDGAFAPCSGNGAGEQVYDDLAEGAHRFSVRAKDGLTGLPATRRFTLDRTAPTVTVFVSGADIVTGDLAPRIWFAEYENGVSYRCSLDGGAWQPCGWYSGLENLAIGVHTLRVVATDAAGNSSDPDAPSASATVRVRAAAAATGRATPQAPARIPAPPVSAAVPLAGAPAAAAPPAARIVVDRKPLLWPFTLRFRGKAAPIRFGLKPSRDAVAVRIRVKNWLGRTVITRTARVKPNAANRVNLRLTRSEQRRLKPGRYLVTAVLRNARGTEGNPQTHWMRVRPSTRK